MIKLAVIFYSLLMFNLGLSAEDEANFFREIIPKFNYQQVLIDLDYQFELFGEVTQTSIDLKSETDQNGKLEKIILTFNGVNCWIINARDLLEKKAVFKRQHLVLQDGLSRIEHKLISIMLNLIDQEIASIEAMPGFSLKEGGELKIQLPRDVRATHKESFDIIVNLKNEIKYSVTFPAPLEEDDHIQVVYWNVFDSIHGQFNQTILEPNYITLDLGISRLKFPGGLSAINYLEDQEKHQKERWSIQAQTIRHIRKANGLQTKWRKL